jgi:hypothetical protein
MAKFQDLEEYRKLILGHRVDRDTENLPQTADGSLFTITGGRVLLTLIYGEVTTVIQSQANNCLLKLNPTATGASQDLCAVLNITADPVGEIYTISGTVGDAMRSDLLIGAGGLTAAPLILKPGIIELEAAASNTGQVQWSAFWLPLDVGADLAVT